MLYHQYERSDFEDGKPIKESVVLTSEILKNLIKPNNLAAIASAVEDAERSTKKKTADEEEVNFEQVLVMEIPYTEDIEFVVSITPSR